MSVIRVLGSVLALVLAATALSCGSDDEGSAGASGSSGASGAAGVGGNTGGTAGTAGSGGDTGGAAGTGGTAGAAGGTTGTCATACANIALASCPEEEDEAGCTAGCEGEQSAITGCEAEFAAMAGCVSTAEVTCDADGFAVFPACDSQELAYVTCSACLSASDDSACDGCLKQSCCDEVTAVRTDPDFEMFLECADSCTSEGCVNGCIASYPSAASSFDAYNQCQDANCMTECFG